LRSLQSSAGIFSVLPARSTRVVRQREQLIDPVPGRPCEEDQPERVGGGVGGEELEKVDRASKIAAVVALAMAVDRHAFQPEPVEVVGWL
jgi:hypothetical protein